MKYKCAPEIEELLVRVDEILYRQNQRKVEEVEYSARWLWQLATTNESDVVGCLKAKKGIGPQAGSRQRRMRQISEKGIWEWPGVIMTTMNGGLGLGLLRNSKGEQRVDGDVGRLTLFLGLAERQAIWGTITFNDLSI